MKIEVIAIKYNRINCDIDYKKSCKELYYND